MRQGRHCHADTGINNEKGSFSNIPAGEAYIAPVEDSANGAVVWDKSMPGIGILKKPIKAEFKTGRIVSVEGAEEAEMLKKMIKGLKGAEIIAEFGVGTNPKSIAVGNPISDEKVLGTVHIAIGDNVNIPIGGANAMEKPIHLDGIIGDPTLKVDGRTIMQDGKLTI